MPAKQIGTASILAINLCTRVYCQRKLAFGQILSHACKALWNRAMCREGPKFRQATSLGLLSVTRGDLSRMGMAFIKAHILSSRGTPEKDVHTPTVKDSVGDEGSPLF